MLKSDKYAQKSQILPFFLVKIIRYYLVSKIPKPKPIPNIRKYRIIRYIPNNTETGLHPYMARPSPSPALRGAD